MPPQDPSQPSPDQQALWDSFFSLVEEKVSYTLGSGDNQRVITSKAPAGSYSATIMERVGEGEGKFDVGTMLLYLDRAIKQKPEEFDVSLNLLNLNKDDPLIQALKLINDLYFNRAIPLRIEEYGIVRYPRALTHYFGKLDPNFIQPLYAIDPALGRTSASRVGIPLTDDELNEEQKETIQKFERGLEEKFKPIVNDLVTSLILKLKHLCGLKGADIKAQIANRLANEAEARAAAVSNLINSLYDIPYYVERDDRKLASITKALIVISNTSPETLLTARDIHGGTVLVTSGLRSSPEIIKAILDKIPEDKILEFINIPDSETGLTPIMMSAHNDPEGVKAFLDKIPEDKILEVLYRRNKEDENVLMIAAKQGIPKCIEYIFDKIPEDERLRLIDNSGRANLLMAGNDDVKSLIESEIAYLEGRSNRPEL